jgi:hypothetical protein
MINYTTMVKYLETNKLITFITNYWIYYFNRIKNNIYNKVAILPYISILPNNEPINDSGFGYAMGIVILYGLIELAYFKYTGKHTSIYTLFIDDPENEWNRNCVADQPKDIHLVSSSDDSLNSLFENTFSFNYLLVTAFIIVLYCSLKLFNSNLRYLNGFALPSTTDNREPLLSKTIFFIYIILLALIITSFSILFKSTFFLLLFISLFSFVFVFLLLFENISFYFFNDNVIEKFLFFLRDIGIISYFYSIHSYIFITCSKTVFVFILWISNIFHIFYMILARYWVYITIFSPIVLSSEYWLFFTIILFITYLGLISKVIINVINLIILTCYNRYPYLLLDSYDPSDTPSPVMPNQAPRNSYSLISKHNHYHLPPHFPRVSSWVKGGVICTAIGIGVACGALYYYRDSALSSRRAADAAVKATDQWEVSNGIMSKEDYLKKYPRG